MWSGGIALNDFDRTLRLYADGKLVDTERIRVVGKSSMTLSPDAWTVSLSNADAGSRSQLGNAKEMVVTNGSGGVLCKGTPVDVTVVTEGVTEIARVLLVSGMDFWRSTVSMSIQGGSSVQETLCMLISRAGLPLSMGLCPGASGRIPSGQTFYGRTAGYVDRLASMIGGRAFTFQGLLGIAVPGDTEAAALTEEMAGEPEEWLGGWRIRTRMIGYPIGQTLKLNGRIYRMVGQEIEADTRQGAWTSYLLLLDDRDIAGRWEDGHGQVG